MERVFGKCAHKFMVVMEKVPRTLCAQQLCLVQVETARLGCNNMNENEYKGGKILEKYKLSSL